MEVQQDFRELLALFNSRKVENVVVGAYALAFHGAPRFTGDMAILGRPGVRSKRAVGRKKDPADIEALGR